MEENTELITFVGVSESETKSKFEDVEISSLEEKVDLENLILFPSESNERIEEEHLRYLLSLEPEELFKKYEENSMNKANSDRTKLEETTETLQDVKNKLKLQREQREIYEKQLNEIKEALHFPLPVENYTFANVLTIVKTLVELNELSENSIYPGTFE